MAALHNRNLMNIRLAKYTQPGNIAHTQKKKTQLFTIYSFRVESCLDRNQFCMIYFVEMDDSHF